MAEEKSQAQKTNQKILKSVEKICKKLDKKAPVRIPNRYEDSVCTGRRKGGYFSYARVISPEASQALKLDALPK